MLRRRRAKPEKLQIRRYLLEQHIRPHLIPAPSLPRGRQKRRDLLLHHHFAHESSGREPVHVHRQRVVLAHAERGGVDDDVEAFGVAGA